MIPCALAHSRALNMAPEPFVGPETDQEGFDMTSATERLDAIQSRMGELRNEKAKITALPKKARRGKNTKASLKAIRKEMHQLAKERSQLPLDLKWSAEELKRRATEKVDA